MRGAQSAVSRSSHLPSVARRDVSSISTNASPSFFKAAVSFLSVMHFAFCVMSHPTQPRPIADASSSRRHNSLMPVSSGRQSQPDTVRKKRPSRAVLEEVGCGRACSFVFLTRSRPVLDYAQIVPSGEWRRTRPDGIYTGQGRDRSIENQLGAERLATSSASHIPTRLKERNHIGGLRPSRTGPLGRFAA